MFIAIISASVVRAIIPLMGACTDYSLYGDQPSG